MSSCKRMTVTAIGIKGTETFTATNYNEHECKNIPGACGCVHAEIALLQQVTPDVLLVSHSPCIDCAKAIVNAGVPIVLYKEIYRKVEGLVLLEGCGVDVRKY